MVDVEPLYTVRALLLVTAVNAAADGDRDVDWALEGFATIEVEACCVVVVVSDVDNPEEGNCNRAR